MFEARLPGVWTHWTILHSWIFLFVCLFQYGIVPVHMVLYSELILKLQKCRYCTQVKLYWKQGPVSVTHSFDCEPKDHFSYAI